MFWVRGEFSWYSAYLKCRKPWVLSLPLHELGIVLCTCNLSTVGCSEVQGHP